MAEFQIGDLVQDMRNNRKAVVIRYGKYDKAILEVLTKDFNRLETTASNWVKIGHYDQVEQIMEELQGD